MRKSKDKSPLKEAARTRLERAKRESLDAAYRVPDELRQEILAWNDGQDFEEIKALLKTTTVTLPVLLDHATALPPELKVKIEQALIMAGWERADLERALSFGTGVEELKELLAAPAQGREVHPHRAPFLAYLKALTPPIDYAAMAENLGEGDWLRIHQEYVRFLGRAERVKEIERLLTPELMTTVAAALAIGPDGSLQDTTLAILIGVGGVDGAPGHGTANPETLAQVIGERLLGMAFEEPGRFDALAVKIRLASDYRERGGSGAVLHEADRLLNRHGVDGGKFEIARGETEAEEIAMLSQILADMGVDTRLTLIRFKLAAQGKSRQEKVALALSYMPGLSQDLATEIEAAFEAAITNKEHERLRRTLGKRDLLQLGVNALTRKRNEEIFRLRGMTDQEFLAEQEQEVRERLEKEKRAAFDKQLRELEEKLDWIQRNPLTRWFGGVWWGDQREAKVQAVVDARDELVALGEAPDAFLPTPDEVAAALGETVQREEKIRLLRASWLVDVSSEAGVRKIAELEPNLSQVENELSRRMAELGEELKDLLSETEDKAKYLGKGNVVAGLRRADFGEKTDPTVSGAPARIEPAERKALVPYTDAELTERFREWEALDAYDRELREIEETPDKAALRESFIARETQNLARQNTPRNPGGGLFGLMWRSFFNLRIGPSVGGELRTRMKSLSL